MQVEVQDPLEMPPVVTNISGNFIFKYENGKAKITASISGFKSISKNADLIIGVSLSRNGIVKTITASTLYSGSKNAKIIVALPRASCPNKFEIRARPTIA